MSAKPKKNLKSVLKKNKVKIKPHKPVWDGPCSDTDQGGVTQSLLTQAILCKERFRLAVIENFKSKEGFKAALEYGNYWHIAEELYTAGESWEKGLHSYCKELCAKHKEDQKEIVKYYMLCMIQFPIYLTFWEKHKHTKSRKHLLSEEAFRVPYPLPDGRVVILRGKFDSVDTVVENRKRVVYLQENKAKGRIEPENLQRQLTFDTQTMIYLIALQQWLKDNKIKNPIAGVRYNVIRRPLSGGAYSIRQHKPTKKNPSGETDTEFYNRLQGLIESDPEFFFMRWKVEVSQQEIEDFKTQFLTPALTNLCDWWEWINAGTIHDPWSSRKINGVLTHNSLHTRYPYGIYNPLNDGKFHKFDFLIQHGSSVGLEKTTTLFPELE